MPEEVKKPGVVVSAAKPAVAAKPGVSAVAEKKPKEPKAAKPPKEPKVKVAKEPKAPRPKMIKGHTYESIIHLGKDKDGKTYGPEHNPKRGTAATRFALYKDGQTIQQALDAGMKQADIAWDSKSDIGFITIEDIKTPAPAPATTSQPVVNTASA